MIKMEYNVIITAGGTSERIDNVRKITNSGSGKLGFMIANKLIQNGSISKIYYILAIISILIWFLYLISNIISVFNVILPLLASILIMSGIMTTAIGLIFEAVLRNDLRQDKEQNYQIESII